MNDRQSAGLKRVVKLIQPRLSQKLSLERVPIKLFRVKLNNQLGKLMVNTLFQFGT